MMDIMALLPHSKKDVKVQAKDNKADTLNELADLKGCSSCLLFEVLPFDFFFLVGKGVLLFEGGGVSSNFRV